MDNTKTFSQFVTFIIISGSGGFLVSLTGLPIGWMIGTLLTASLLSILRPKIIRLSNYKNGVPKYWLYMGQCILGIELGQQVNGSVINIFQENWLSITIILLLSILFSLISGLILWKYTELDMLTSFFSTTPGGLSSIPSIAEEAGANTGIVSMIQVIRVFLVLMTIPVIISFLFRHEGHTNHIKFTAEPGFEAEQISVTILLVLLACAGFYIGKIIKLPAPWLIGSMISIACFKAFSPAVISYDLTAWWPQNLIVVSQILIGASIGSRFYKNMFLGIRKTIFVSLFSIMGLIVCVFVCTYILSTLTDLSFLTSGLAFAPGGIAEMTTTALVLNGDATFVVAVQVLRVITVCLTLPTFFKFLKYMDSKKNSHSHISA